MRGGYGALAIDQGVYGLRRAFLLAGAETVVSSLWSVDEPSASRLIRLYYAKLQPGKKGRAEVLDEATQGLRQDKEHPENSHPSYWAPFVVRG